MHKEVSDEVKLESLRGKIKALKIDHLKRLYENLVKIFSEDWILSRNQAKPKSENDYKNLISNLGKEFLLNKLIKVMIDDFYREETSSDQPSPVLPRTADYHHLIKNQPGEEELDEDQKNQLDEARNLIYEMTDRTLFYFLRNFSHWRACWIENWKTKAGVKAGDKAIKLEVAINLPFRVLLDPDVRSMIDRFIYLQRRKMDMSDYRPPLDWKKRYEDYLAAQSGFAVDEPETLAISPPLTSQQPIEPQIKRLQQSSKTVLQSNIAPPQTPASGSLLKKKPDHKKRTQKSSVLTSDPFSIPTMTGQLPSSTGQLPSPTGQPYQEVSDTISQQDEGKVKQLKEMVKSFNGFQLELLFFTLAKVKRSPILPEQIENTSKDVLRQFAIGLNRETLLTKEVQDKIENLYNRQKQQDKEKVNQLKEIIKTFDVFQLELLFLTLANVRGRSPILPEEIGNTSEEDLRDFALGLYLKLLDKDVQDKIEELSDRQKQQEEEKVNQLKEMIKTFHVFQLELLFLTLAKVIGRSPILPEKIRNTSEYNLRRIALELPRETLLAKDVQDRIEELNNRQKQIRKTVTSTATKPQTFTSESTIETTRPSGSGFWPSSASPEMIAMTSPVQLPRKIQKSGKSTTKSTTFSTISVAPGRSATRSTGSATISKPPEVASPKRIEPEPSPASKQPGATTNEQTFAEFESKFGQQSNAEFQSSLLQHFNKYSGQQQAQPTIGQPQPSDIGSRQEFLDFSGLSSSAFEPSEPIGQLSGQPISGQQQQPAMPTDQTQITGQPQMQQTDPLQQAIDAALADLSQSRKEELNDWMNSFLSQETTGQQSPQAADQSVSTVPATSDVGSQGFLDFDAGLTPAIEPSEPIGQLLSQPISSQQPPQAPSYQQVQEHDMERVRQLQEIVKSFNDFQLQILFMTLSNVRFRSPIDLEEIGNTSEDDLRQFALGLPTKTLLDDDVQKKIKELNKLPKQMSRQEEHLETVKKLKDLTEYLRNRNIQNQYLEWLFPDRRIRDETSIASASGRDIEEVRNNVDNELRKLAQRMDRETMMQRLPNVYQRIGNVYDQQDLNQPISSQQPQQVPSCQQVHTEKIQKKKVKFQYDEEEKEIFNTEEQRVESLRDKINDLSLPNLRILFDNLKQQKVVVEGERPRIETEYKQLFRNLTHPQLMKNERIIKQLHREQEMYKKTKKQKIAKAQPKSTGQQSADKPQPSTSGFPNLSDDSEED